MDGSTVYVMDPSYGPADRGIGGFAVAEETCRPARTGHRDLCYADAAIGFVLNGWFDYRAQGGGAISAPGSMVFGNEGEQFVCRHMDPFGNRRLVAHVESALVEQVAQDCGLADARFPAVVQSPGAASVRMYGWMRKLMRGGPGSEETLQDLVESALRVEARRALTTPITAREHGRIQDVVRHIEVAYAEPCSLAALADLAGLSRWHFVRRFRQVAGQSPNQYLIHTRIRAAAERLLAGSGSISEIALDVGFNDISHFNASFRSVFACSPRAWRNGRSR